MRRPVLTLQAGAVPDISVYLVPFLEILFVLTQHSALC